MSDNHLMHESIGPFEILPSYHIYFLSRKDFHTLNDYPASKTSHVII